MRKKVLVVDDQQVYRELLKIYLSKLDYQVKEASDGLQVLEHLQKDDFDLLICDIMMPNMDGWQVLKAVRSNERIKNIPVIVLTAKDEGADMSKGYDLGANYYLTKPFTKPQLLYGVNLMFDENR
jgi:CheY-like chemotaxis protein